MENQFTMIWLVLALPIVGWLIQCLVGKRVIDTMGIAAGRKTMGALAVAPIAIGFAIAVFLTQKLAALPVGERVSISTIGDWITILGLRIPFELRVDPLSMTMVLVITGIGSLIHLYATGYMSEEKDYARFFAYLNLFIAFMLMLVLGNNLLLLFIGWEGVGLCSYLLIGFWYQDINNSKAANKAFIVNRIGDVGLILGIFLLAALLMKNGSMLPPGETRLLSYDVMMPILPEMLKAEPGMATAIALCLFVGAMGKSAQFPLYIWLPDAMAGPTPVSALIHAATMVTSGVVLLNRMSGVFEASAIASSFIVIIGVITAIYAALIAFGQTDIKKVLAYSTVSQLGLMFIACGAGLYWVGMFHVITHAFFKALLFLGSGAVIHAMAHNQDMRNYGGLSKYVKITFISMLIGHLAISGLPLTSGWFSKEEIIHGALYSKQAMIGDINVGLIGGWLGFFAALLTAIYMTRMMMLTFSGKDERWKLIPAVAGHHGDHAHSSHLQDDHGHADHGHSDHGHHGEDKYHFYYTSDELAKMHDSHGDHDHHHQLDENHKPHEVPISMWSPLVILAFFSLISGLWLLGYKKVFPTLPTNTLENWLASGAQWGAQATAEHGGKGEYGKIAFDFLVGPLGYSIGIIGMLIGFIWYFKGLPKSEGWDLSKWSGFRKSAGNQFGYDDAMVEMGVEGGGSLANFTWKILDAKIIDGFINGLAKITGLLGLALKTLQTGNVRGYALMILAGGASILVYVVYVLSQRGGKL